MPQHRGQGLIVTADDLGLSREINEGILEGHRRGIVTSASLLMNGPATEAAIVLARGSPRLEIGIHLSLVEGLALSERPSTVSDSLRYFDDRLCLIRHWRTFLRKWAQGRIRLADIETELELQIQAFKTHYSHIPFANATQHLHLLPGIQDLVLRLCVRHDIPRLRIPWRRTQEPMRWPRRVAAGAMRLLGKRMKRKADRMNCRTTAHFFGFGHSGRMTVNTLETILNSLPAEGVSEIMVHPGNDCAWLRRDLPWAYGGFDWEGELNAVTSPVIRALLAARGIGLATFESTL
jgi:predicted glycoside hydrolase/deacetylase ChbG (UPF0249 family)